MTPEVEGTTLPHTPNVIPEKRSAHPGSSTTKGRQQRAAQIPTQTTAQSTRATARTLHLIEPRTNRGEISEPPQAPPVLPAPRAGIQQADRVAQVHTCDNDLMVNSFARLPVGLWIPRQARDDDGGLTPRCLVSKTLGDNAAQQSS
ncbi:hypothetical protein [Pseudovibrio exalbescens]|uniref:hypothetical protein n=1 Tax=Pseudovibrio exalbescens TaxID=197461 RepID=UPI0011614064|nr:hypothetical protein [Pseudovibrio exalbescens]